VIGEPVWGGAVRSAGKNMKGKEVEGEIAK